MITWMQRHKKWLVITIWISTIAFVGAGFVGWGSYDYGSKGGAVAVVGDREITVEEYQKEYSAVYEQYARLLGDQFNQEMADKLNLKDAAYEMLIQKNLILSYADELGLDVTNEEVAKQLVQISAFIKDGKFDKDTYIKVLAQNRTNPTAFEASLKRDLLLQKVENLFNVEASKKEVENLSKLLFAEDKISINLLNASDVVANITDADVKKYWEENKVKYQSQPAFELAYEKIDLLANNFSDEEISKHYNKFKSDFRKDDGKIKTLEDAKIDVIRALNVKATRKAALKKHLAIKKGKEEFTNKGVIFEDKLAYSAENNKKITESIPGTLLKPFLDGNSYVIVKVLATIPSKPLSFEKAKDLATADYEVVAKTKALDKKADAIIKNFTGKSLGYVSRTSVDKIDGLNHQEALQFLNTLFSTSSKIGKVNLGAKVVVYKIEDSRLGSYDSSKDEAVKATVNNLMNQELMTNFVKSLETRYEVQSSINTAQEK